MPMISDCARDHPRFYALNREAATDQGVKSIRHRARIVADNRRRSITPIRTLDPGKDSVDLLCNSSLYFFYYFCLLFFFLV